MVQLNDLISIIGIGSFVGMVVGCMVGFNRDVTARTQKKMLRLATVSLFAFISWFIWG